MINFKPNTVWNADNLNVMRGINSESVDLIYVDPPFNSKVNYATISPNTEYIDQLTDSWNLNDINSDWIDLLAEEHGELFGTIRSSLSDSNKAYFTFIAIRLLEMYRLLKPTGSFYFHCDSRITHWLRVILNLIFGESMFRNEIIWMQNNNRRSTNHFVRSYDSILFYSKTNIFTFNSINETRTKSDKKCNQIIRKEHVQLLNRDINNMKDIWNIPSIRPKEHLGYLTQKPLALLEKIIKISSNPGDIIFDPFCGTATTLVAAEKLNRKWVGIDVFPKVYEIVKSRIEDYYESKHHKRNSEINGNSNAIILRLDIPRRTDIKAVTLSNDHLRGKEQTENLYLYCNSYNENINKHDNNYKMKMLNMIQL